MSTKQCRFCGAKLKHTFVDLGPSPLANAYLKPEELEQMEPFYPLHVYVCSSCFLVQLPEWESPENIFGDYAYFSSYSDSWLQHAKDYTEEIIPRVKLNPESLVVEIASNDGYLLQYFMEQGIPVLGIEPARNVAEAAIEKGIPTEIVFFGRNIAENLAADGKQADLIVGNNVLAHVPDINDFVRGMKELLKPDGAITMEFPHLMRLMEENQFDTIYHEHFSYFSFLVVERIFAEHELVLFDVDELPTHGGSLRIYARHVDDDSKPVSRRADDLRAREKGVGFDGLEQHLSFGGRVEKTKRSLLKFLISKKAEDKSIVGYGAPAKGNTLLNYCGIRTDFIDYTVDRSPHKQGLFLPGTRIPILAPEKIGAAKPDYVLILPWNLEEEITEQMGYIREWGGKFIVPIPGVRVVE